MASIILLLFGTNNPRGLLSNVPCLNTTIPRRPHSTVISSSVESPSSSSSSSYSPSSTTSTNQKTPQEFRYSRASPSSRWPHLKSDGKNRKEKLDSSLSLDGEQGQQSKSRGSNVYDDNTNKAKLNTPRLKNTGELQQPKEKSLKGREGSLDERELNLSHLIDSKQGNQSEWIIVNKVLDGSDPEENISTEFEAISEVGVDSGKEEDDELPPLRSRTKMKKMNKLALKRAKDWRQRVQLVTSQILNLRPNEFVADVLDRRKVQMTPTDYCFVVKCVGTSNWQRALEIYEWLNIKHWYTPNARMVATIVSVLGRANQESLAEEVFSRVEPEMGDVAQVYNSMMGVHARRGKFGKVLELFNLMRSRGCEPDLVSFNTLINAKAKAGMILSGSTSEILSDMRKFGLRTDIVTYNTLISACSSGLNLVDAVQVYQEMQSRGCQPDLWTYNAMISVYGRCGMAKDAELLMKELGRKGFYPDAVTYNSLLYAFARDGNVEKVDGICKEMLESGFKLDEISYNTTIHMYGKQGRHDLAFQLYKDMKVSGSHPDAVTYTVLVDSLGKTDQIAEAANVFLEMIDSGVKPTLRTFSALICGYAKAGMREEAKKTFEHMVRCGIKPDQLAYSVVLDVLLRSNDGTQAMVLYQRMLADGFRPDRSLYEFMIHTFSKERKHEDVERVIRDLKESSNMDPRAICAILVNAEDYERAAEFLKLAIRQGHEPERNSLLPILNSYLASDARVKAEELLDFLRAEAPGSCALVHEAFITVLCRSRELEAAIQEYLQLRSTGCEVSPAIYEDLILCCEEMELYHYCSQLFSDMRFYGVEPTKGCYRSMIAAYCKMDFPETAHHLIQMAEESNVQFEDLFIYVTLIESYGKQKLWQRAESVVGELRQSSTINRKIWNALINAYAFCGFYEKARAVFNKMLKDGPAPNVESVNGLMQALVTAERLDELYVVIQDLQDMGFKISKNTIVLILDAFARSGNIFEVKKIYHGMKAAGHLPTMHLYRSMIKLFSKGKRVKDVEAMVAEMEETGLKPDLAILNYMLRLYTEISDFRRTMDVYRRIRESGFEPNEDTYNTVICMYSRDLRAEEAFALLDEMTRKGLQPKLDSCKSLLSACGRQQFWDLAEELFQNMISSGCKIDRTVYHIMMKNYRKSGQHSKAENILLLMKAAGIEPTVATMHMLMDSYGMAGHPTGAQNVLNNLKNSGLNVGTAPYASVIDAFLKAGDHGSSIEHLFEMKKEGVDPDYRIWMCFIRAASLCKVSREALALLKPLCEAGFDLPLRLLTEKAEHLLVEVDRILTELLLLETNAAFMFVNVLEDLLWAFERRATASWVFQLAIKKNIYRHDVFRVAEKDWGADFRKLSPGAALVGLTLWLDHMQDASLQGFPESPKSVVLITGTAEYHKVFLSKTIKSYLWEMGSPFLPCKTRSGVLIAKSHSLRMWLKESAFCTDLELRDASSIPELNSVQLYEGSFMRAGLVPALKDIYERLGDVRPKKFAKLALLSGEKRDKFIEADIKGAKEKSEKMKKRGNLVNLRRGGKYRGRRVRHNNIGTQKI